MKEYIFKLSIKVRDYEVDSEGIVNNAVYMHYMEHTRHEFCEQAGFSFRQMSQQGLVPVVSHVDIRYRSSLGLGQSMVSCLNLKRRGPVYVFEQDIYTTGGQPVITATVDIVCTVNGRLTRGDELAAPFARYLT